MNKAQYDAQPIPAVTAKSTAIIEAVKASSFVIAPSNSFDEFSGKLAGVCVWQDTNGRQEVVALYTGHQTDYYTLNKIDFVNGVISVTSDACGGIVPVATADPETDVKAIVNRVNWDMVEKHPVLTPGQYFNFVLK